MFSNVWSENTAVFERLMEIHSNSPKLYYGFNVDMHCLNCFAELSISYWVGTGNVCLNSKYTKPRIAVLRMSVEDA